MLLGNRRAGAWWCRRNRDAWGGGRCLASAVLHHLALLSLAVSATHSSLSASHLHGSSLAAVRPKGSRPVLGKAPMSEDHESQDHCQYEKDDCRVKELYAVPA